MISYEDLVYALNEWRARQGLPTSSTGGAAQAAPPAPAMRAAPPPAAPAPAPSRRSAPVMAAAAPAPAMIVPDQWAPDPAGQEMTYQSDDIAIEGEYSEDAGEAMSFDSMRPSTQPGFAPVAGTPGTRR